ncbi:MAG: P-II family nitrogen regulator [Lachnospiraceae bacterium]|nr:P-II family nitrogen regulator [Lachnospiraceae bacterium]
MKEIIAIIRPNMYFQTKEALHNINIYSMNSQLVYGRGKNHDINLTINHGTTENKSIEGYSLLAKKQINIVARDNDVQKIVDTIISTNSTNTSGDGKIFIIPTEKVVRIRTGVCDDDALV